MTVKTNASLGRNTEAAGLNCQDREAPSCAPAASKNLTTPRTTLAHPGPRFRPSPTKLHEFVPPIPEQFVHAPALSLTRLAVGRTSGSVGPSPPQLANARRVRTGTTPRFKSIVTTHPPRVASHQSPNMCPERTTSYLYRGTARNHRIQDHSGRSHSVGEVPEAWRKSISYMSDSRRTTRSAWRRQPRPITSTPLLGTRIERERQRPHPAVSAQDTQHGAHLPAPLRLHRSQAQYTPQKTSQLPNPKGAT